VGGVVANNPSILSAFQSNDWSSAITIGLTGGDEIQAEVLNAKFESLNNRLIEVENLANSSPISCSDLSFTTNIFGVAATGLETVCASNTCFINEAGNSCVNSCSDGSSEGQCLPPYSPNFVAKDQSGNIIPITNLQTINLVYNNFEYLSYTVPPYHGTFLPSYGILTQDYNLSLEFRNPVVANGGSLDKIYLIKWENNKCFISFRGVGGTTGTDSNTASVYIYDLNGTTFSIASCQEATSYIYNIDPNDLNSGAFTSYGYVGPSVDAVRDHYYDGSVSQCTGPDPSASATCESIFGTGWYHDGTVCTQCI